MYGIYIKHFCKMFDLLRISLSLQQYTYGQLCTLFTLKGYILLLYIIINVVPLRVLPQWKVQFFHLFNDSITMVSSPKNVVNTICYC